MELAVVSVRMIGDGLFSAHVEFRVAFDAKERERFILVVAELVDGV
jgi:hypothetical protein